MKIGDELEFEITRFRKRLQELKESHLAQIERIEFQIETLDKKIALIDLTPDPTQQPADSGISPLSDEEKEEAPE